MKTRKHQCRIQLAASEPVAYRLVCMCVCPRLWGQISRKPKETGEKLLWGAYRKGVGVFRMVTSPMTSRDRMTS